jgi:hypothetical protein
MPTIETFFIDAATGDAIGQTDVPAEQLPASFNSRTTLHIGDEDWHVLKAEPVTAEEFLRTGRLVLTLQKIVTVPAKDLLFSLPTICDVIPAVLPGSTKRGKHVLELHEDDWRQIEFVSVSCRPVIEAEIASISAIYQTAFKEIHVRKSLAAPLNRERLLLNQLASFFTGAPEIYDGVAYEHLDGLLEGGFACRLGTVVFYGQQSEGTIRTLGTKIVEETPEAHKETAQALQRFMEACHLYLIDWCASRLLMADAEMITALLER